MVGWREMSVKMKTSLGRVEQNEDLKKTLSWVVGWKDKIWYGG